MVGAAEKLHKALVWSLFCPGRRPEASVKVYELMNGEHDRKHNLSLICQGQ